VPVDSSPSCCTGLPTLLKRCYTWLGVERAVDTPATALQHMRIDHGSADVLVSQKFLHGTDVIAIFQQMRGKTMATLIVTLLIIRR
jgi:hypothetical protein